MGATGSHVEYQSLEGHNRFRIMHGCPLLKLDHKMSKLAEEWAEHLAAENKFEYSKNIKYGQNVCMSSDLVVTGDYAARIWYEESKKYNYNVPKFSTDVGQFAQVICKNTVKLGVGMAMRGDTTWIVAYYSPPGNIHGQFKENVPDKCVEDNPIVRFLSGGMLGEFEPHPDNRVTR